MTELELQDMLFKALNSRYGYKVTTSEPEKLRQQLYKIRKRDKDFEILSFAISPDYPETELWIVRKPEVANAKS